MTTGGQKRTRSERVAALELPPGRWEKAWADLGRRDVLGRIALTLLCAVLMAVVIRAWDPPLAFRTGYTPQRDVVARVSFQVVNPEETRSARRRAQEQVRQIYVHDPQPLVQLRAQLRNSIVELTAAKSLDEVSESLWKDFEILPAGQRPSLTDAERQQQFEAFRAAFTGQENMDRFERALADVFDPLEATGLLKNLDRKVEIRGNQEEILVHRVDEPEPLQIVPVSDVQIGDFAGVKETLLESLDSDDAANRLFAWLKPRLADTVTLTLDEEATRRDQQKAAEAVDQVVDAYKAGQTLAEAGRPLAKDAVAVLATEYAVATAGRDVGQRLVRFVTVVLLVFFMFILCGLYMRYGQPGPLVTWRRLTVILMLAVITVAVARWASTDAWRGELAPLMLFGMTMAIVQRRELALLLTGVLAVVLVLAIGHGLHEFFLLLGATTAAILNVGHIRTRSKLIYIGLFAGAVAFLLQIAMGVIENQPLGLKLLQDAGRSGLWALAAGFLMTGLLPFIERLFGVLTDLSLLELGDVTHPLLQELIRRAPSTYNHSVTVGTISEAAADAIGARGLLVRVGAYFHDIGKMLKPGYFIENQGADENRHETLVPTMSSLVIVAHIKDGADLARQHHLPEPIIDLIEQHHGTTRVGFFFERAAQQKQSDPNGGEVDESSFRYPGPKPQTKEAGVLMLADVVESASRTLVDPTPARIESLVREVAERRLRAGQFDESGLTLRELRTIEKSMVMSLISIYHGRIKYPDQRTA